MNNTPRHNTGFYDIDSSFLRHYDTLTRQSRVLATDLSQNSKAVADALGSPVGKASNYDCDTADSRLSMLYKDETYVE
jgi:hypothetical protein